MNHQITKFVIGRMDGWLDGWIVLNLLTIQFISHIHYILPFFVNLVLKFVIIVFRRSEGPSLKVVTWL